MSERNESPLGVGLVGCGRIARTHLQALDAVEDFRLVAVCDLREEAARAFAEESAEREEGIAIHTDPRRLLKTVGLDAVIVATPPNTHSEIAGAFLDRGVHVLCEKPLALTPREAETLVAKAEKAGRLLMMASKFRYCDDVMEAKRIIDSGLLGELILYENVFCSRVEMGNRWNSRAEISGGGVLIDNGTHSVDIARYLLGPIVSVQAEGGQRVQSLEVEDTCRLYLRTAAGAMGAVDLSWSIHKERDAYVEVFGSQGVLSVGWRESKYRVGEDPDWVRFGSGYDKAAAFVRQLGNFAGSIRGDEQPLISAEDSLESVRVIEAAYRSMRMDNWVSVGGPRPAVARDASGERP